ncbi:hypothetical protein [Halomicrobium urmianum]|uniref:hypothetical protein n=1 Tax=Halomicrobium urmianum TaxID=1586233 RepID=UPI001CD92991|nr:hypothetical protein [Halomicrobium urmianum]
MRRRALLTSLATGTATLSGCSVLGSPRDEQSTVTPAPVPDEAGDGSAGNGTETDGSSTDESPTADGWPDDPASVIDLETGPRTYALGPTRFHTDDYADVRLAFDRTATADHPARVRGVLENANDFESTFRVEWLPAVGRVHGRQPDGYDHEARLHLVPTANNDLAETVPEVTRDDGYWYVADVGPWMTDTRRLDPGERVRVEYRLVGEQGTERPTGTYEFRGRDETVRIAVWDTTGPGPEAESRFAGRSVPVISRGDSEQTVQWYHEADASTRAFVRPSVERRALDGRIEFEMVNHSRETLRCGHWNLYKLADGQWYHVAPWGHTADCRGLAPGDRKTWPLRAFTGDPVPCDDHSGLTAGFLGGGIYAVVAGYGRNADASGALVELVGDPVEVVPTGDAAAERDGGTVTVTTDSYGDGERPADAALAMAPADDADEQSPSIPRSSPTREAADRRLIAEVLMRDRNRALRNALAHAADDVERVVVRTDERAVDRTLGYDSDRRRFRFRGQTYEARRAGNGD